MRALFEMAFKSAGDAEPFNAEAFAEEYSQLIAIFTYSGNDSYSGVKDLKCVFPVRTDLYVEGFRPGERVRENNTWLLFQEESSPDMFFVCFGFHKGCYLVTRRKVKIA
jgi:hypothetical protein